MRYDVANSEHAFYAPKLFTITMPEEMITVTNRK